MPASPRPSAPQPANPFASPEVVADLDTGLDGWLWRSIPIGGLVLLDLGPAFGWYELGVLAILMHVALFTIGMASLPIATIYLFLPGDRPTFGRRLFVEGTALVGLSVALMVLMLAALELSGHPGSTEILTRSMIR